MLIYFYIVIYCNNLYFAQLFLDVEADLAQSLEKVALDFNQVHTLESRLIRYT